MLFVLYAKLAMKFMNLIASARIMRPLGVVNPIRSIRIVDSLRFVESLRTVVFIGIEKIVKIARILCGFRL